MKKLSILLTGAAMLTLLVSCEKKSSADVSRITEYPIIELQGDDVILHPKGTPFTDPGVTATEGSSEIEVNQSVRGVFRGGSGTEVDVNKADHYIITYSAENKDGFSGQATRSVWVAETGDLVNSIEGLYSSTVVRNGASGAQYTNMKYILIWKNADGTYGISDGIGGYYDYGRDYGVGYAAQGARITANDISANDFSYGSSFPVGAFGGVATISNMMVDPANNKVTFTTTWDAGYTFEVELTQIQL